MALVAALGRGERALGGEAEALVRLALQGREVVQERRLLDERLPLDRLDDRVGAARQRGDALGLLRALEAVRRALLPHAGVALDGGGVELGLHLPVVLGDERRDLEVAPHDQREGRRLHPAERDRRARRADASGRGARRVHADQPVGLGASPRRVLERSELGVVAQVLERVADRGLRHRREPRAAHRLLHVRGLQDELEDQLALAPGVACVDELVDVLPAHRGVQAPQLLPGLRVARLVAELVRQDRQVLEAPALVAGVVGVWIDLLDEVSDGEADDVRIGLVEVVRLREVTGQGRDEVAGHARLLADDQGLGHLLDPSSRSGYRRGRSGYSRTSRPRSRTKLCVVSTKRTRLQRVHMTIECVRAASAT